MSVPEYSYDIQGQYILLKSNLPGFRKVQCSSSMTIFFDDFPELSLPNLDGEIYLFIESVFHGL